MIHLKGLTKAVRFHSFDDLFTPIRPKQTSETKPCLEGRENLQNQLA